MFWQKDTWNICQLLPAFETQAFHYVKISTIQKFYRITDDIIIYLLDEDLFVAADSADRKVNLVFKHPPINNRCQT